MNYMTPVLSTLLFACMFSSSEGRDADSMSMKREIMDDREKEEINIDIRVGNHSFSAVLYNNATVRALVKCLPVTLAFKNLYNREMCYRFPEALPVDKATVSGYEVGDIVYYPPMHSLVIMYAQDGERFSMQKLGRIKTDIRFFRNMKNAEIHMDLSDK